MKNLYLIGYRCTGKTTVGRILAERLNMRFVDLDREITENAGVEISQMVEEHGWSYFRDLERKTLSVHVGTEGEVVSTGGGIIENSDNVADMRNDGMVVWLRAAPATIYKRMTEDEGTEANRPALTDKSAEAEIGEVLERRIPLYEAAAMISVDTENIGIETVCEIILKQMKGSHLQDT